MRRPRRAVHGGSVEAVGLLLDGALAGPDAMVARIVAAWEPGVTVQRTQFGLWVRFARPKRVTAQTAGGLPLTLRRHGAQTICVSAPLSDDEVEALAPPPGALVVVVGGDAHVLDPATLDAIDVARWIDLSSARVLDVVSLGEPPPPPAAAIVPVSTDTRQLFQEAVGAPAAGSRAVTAALARLSPDGAPAGVAPDGESAQPGVRNALRDFLVGSLAVTALSSLRLFAALANALSGKQKRADATWSNGGTPTVPTEPFELPGWLRAALTQIGGVVGALLVIPLLPLALVLKGLGKLLASSSPSTSGAAPRPPGVLSRVASGLFTFARTRLSQLFAWLRGGPSRSAPSSSLAAEPREPPGPGWMDRAFSRMSTWLARALVAAKLAHLVGRKQAQYLGELIDMLQRGDLDQALRHAIPLAGPGAASSDGVALGVPKARSDLAIRFGAVWPSSGIGLGGELFDELRRLYRGAFERLERDGRIEEAAFVLAELLYADEEAVAFLERHARLRMAAELAEGRKLAAGIVVRQWFLAGERARAVKIARRHGAFADAVVRLERSSKQTEANALRMVWADTLADAGDYAAAVDACWSVEAARPVATVWLDLAIDLGGVVGARMSARKLGALAAEPELVRQIAPHVAELLADDEVDGPELRRAFAKALVEGVVTPVTRTFARPTMRALWADLEANDDGTVRGLVARLQNLSGDRAMSVDAPPLPIPLARTNSPLRRRIGRADTGTSPVFDAAALPGRRVVVALGELGVWLSSRDGAHLATFDQPAVALVLSDHGDRAITVARRGDAVRLGRIDLQRRRSAPWCEAMLDAFATDFDGSQWLLVPSPAAPTDKPRIAVIDALDDGWSALYRHDVDGRCIGVARAPTQGVVLVDDVAAPGTLHRMAFELPSWTLRAVVDRKGQPTDVDLSKVAVASSGSAGGDLFHATIARPDAIEIVRVTAAEVFPVATVPLGSANERATALHTCATHAVATLMSDQGARVVAVHQTNGAVGMELSLDGATRCGVRLAGDTLVVWDDLGRVLAVDLHHRRISWEMRV